MQGVWFFQDGRGRRHASNRKDNPSEYGKNNGQADQGPDQKDLIETRLVKSLYKAALSYGMLPSVFWDMTVDEIQDWIDAAIDRIKLEQEQKDDASALLAWRVGLACRVAIPAAMDSSVNYPDFFEMFPSKMSDEMRAEREAASWVADRAALTGALNMALPDDG